LQSATVVPPATPGDIVEYGTSVPSNGSNPYYPYNALPNAASEWRVQPDANGHTRFTSEEYDRPADALERGHLIAVDLVAST
jgi:hypothetical protein